MAGRRLEVIGVTEETQEWLVGDLSWLTVGKGSRGLVPACGGFAIVSAGLRPMGDRWPDAERHSLTTFAFAADGTQVALSRCTSSSGPCHPDVCGTAVVDLGALDGGDAPFLRAEGTLTDPDAIRLAIAEASAGRLSPDRDPRMSRCAFGVVHALRAAGHRAGGVGIDPQTVGDIPVLGVMAEATESLVMPLVASGPLLMRAA